VQPQAFKTFKGKGVVKLMDGGYGPSQGMKLSLDDASTIELTGLNFPKFTDGAELQVQFASFAGGPRDGDIVIQLRNQTGKLLFFSYRAYFDPAVLETFKAPFTLSFEPSCRLSLDTCYESSTVLWTSFSYGGDVGRIANRQPATLMLEQGHQSVIVDYARDLVGFSACPDVPLPGRYLIFQILDESLR